MLSGVSTKVKTLLFIFTVVLAFGFGIASTATAANYVPFKLGRMNTSEVLMKLTKLGPGPALSLITESGPPLKVNSDAKVTNFNADLVDGLDASELRGQQGPQGEQGEPGPQGERGPSNLYVDTVTSTSVSTGDTPSAQLKLPEGNYMASASATFLNRYDFEVTVACTITPGLSDQRPARYELTLDPFDSRSGVLLEKDTLTFDQAVSSIGSTQPLRLICTSNSPDSGTAGIAVSNLQLSAVEVESISLQ